MYLSKEQICEYAADILKTLGKEEYERDVIYGGDEWLGTSYVGYGLSIRDYEIVKIVVRLGL